jgi:NADH-quinone oxidoreductase subunit N
MISIAVGSISALFERDLKRLIAYSAIANIGIMGTGLCGDIFMQTSVTLYLVIYIFNSVQLFVLLLSMHYMFGSMEGVTDVIKPRSAPYYGVIVTVCLYPLAGLPPFPGSIAKSFIITTLIEQGKEFVAWYILIRSIITCVYYIRLLRLCMMSTEKKDLYIQVPNYR